ncbi:hypothetical protein ACP70R_048305 [Stipagrostis hirtigluma subsp. patula]
MFRWSWSKSSKSASPASSGEVAVQKVERIEVHNLVMRPPFYGAPRPPLQGGEAEGDDIDRKAAEFIKLRKMWFHSQKPAGPAATKPPPS